MKKLKTLEVLLIKTAKAEFIDSETGNTEA